MIGERRSDATEMFLHACSFVDCAEHYDKIESDAMHRATWCSAPKIVNTAFACEIFLKTLLTSNGIEYKRAHNLEHLYNLLPANYQSAIEQEIIVRFGKTKDMFGFTYFHNVSMAFNDWRYSFERRRLNIDLGFLNTFCELLREMCCQDLYGQSWETIQRRMK